jgi:nitrite reductase/ring-hydroxylating ferredoxin subunit
MGQYIKVAKVNEIPSGTAKSVDVQGIRIALFNLDGNFYAIGNTCTHRGGPLAEGFISGDEVTCPWHGGRFKIQTGKVCGPPPANDVPQYNLRVEGEDVEVEV